MRKSMVLTLLFAAALSACAQQQTVILGHSTVALTGPWKFSPGDSPWVGTPADGHFLWAQPGFDDSGWHDMNLTPLPGSIDVLFGTAGYVPGWTKRGYPGLTGFAWYRLRLHIGSHGQPLWIKMPPDIDDGFQVFANGKCIGQFGHFGPRGVTLYYSHPAMFELPAAAPNGSIEIAVRFYMSAITALRWPDAGGMHSPPLMGLEASVVPFRNLEENNLLQAYFGACLAVTVLSLILPFAFWAWVKDRRERIWQWLLLAAAAQLTLGVGTLTSEFSLRVSMGEAECLRFVFGAPAVYFCWILFWFHWFGLERRHWIARAAWLLAVADATNAFCFRSPLLGFHFASPPLLHFCSAATVWISSAEGILALVLLAAALRKDRLAALLATLPILLLALQGFMVPLLVVFELPSEIFISGLGISNLDVEVILMILIVGVLALRRFLADRERQAAGRESVARDLEQARQLQQGVLVPEPLCSATYKVDVEYRPAQSVGGDFFQTIPRPDGNLVVIIGDVSGKGVSAAMLVAVLVGAARAIARQTSDPAVILAELNLQLLGRSGGHFATCLVGALRPDGALYLANAGHLPPYRNGEELPLPPALPLGVSSDAEYAETTLQLTPGDSLTFLSDGVVEAQSATDELFGFDRTRAISAESAETIATAAQAHGQQDDITVLTLTFAPAEVIHA
jgi:hypothetical protein